MHSETSPEPASIVETAADWLDRLPTLTPAEVDVLEAWLAEDVAHRRAFEQLQRLLGDAALAEAVERVRPSSHAREKPPRRTRSARGQGDYRRLASWGVPLSAAAAFALLVLFVLKPHTSLVPARTLPGEAAIEYATNLGAPADARLADRSVIHLDARSAVRVAYTARHRGIRLERGEAMFEVAHDPGRPFDVDAAGATVTAVGTVFDVDLTEGLVDIRVYQGVVRIHPVSGEPSLLRAGERLTLAAGRPSVLRHFSPDLTRTWRASWLDADDMPLGQAVAKLNRYAARPIVLRSEALAEQPLSGSFNLRRTDATVAMLAALLDLGVTKDHHGIYLTPRATNQGAGRD